MLVPLLGALGLPLAAVPAVRLTHRRGLSAGLIACVLGGGFVLLLGLAAGGGAVRLALLAGGVTCLPAIAAASVRRGFSPSSSFLLLCLAGFLVIGSYALLPLSAGGRSIEAEIGSSFDQMIASAVESYSRTDAGLQTIEKVRDTLTASRRLAQKFWIGLLGASWTLAAAISFYAGSRSARPAPSAEAARFETLRVPAPAAALFVLAGGAAALLPAARNAAGNLLVTLSALFFVAGLSIICHFARRWIRVRVLRIGLYALVVYFPMNVGVALLGLFDWYADFRRRGEGARDKV